MLLFPLRLDYCNLLYLGVVQSSLFHFCLVKKNKKKYCQASYCSGLKILGLVADCTFSVAAPLFSCQFMYFIVFYTLVSLCSLLNFVRLYRILVSSSCFKHAFERKVPCLS